MSSNTIFCNFLVLFLARDNREVGSKEGVRGREERTIAQRNHDNAKDNMMFLFGRELALTPLPEVTRAPTGPVHEDKHIDREIESEADDSTTAG